MPTVCNSVRSPRGQNYLNLFAFDGITIYWHKCIMVSICIHYFISAKRLVRSYPVENTLWSIHVSYDSICLSVCPAAWGCHHTIRYIVSHDSVRLMWQQAYSDRKASTSIPNLPNVPCSLIQLDLSGARCMIDKGSFAVFLLISMISTCQHAQPVLVYIFTCWTIHY